MRKLLNWDTTYINRENTNAKIQEEVNKRIKETTEKNNRTRTEQNNIAKHIKTITTFAEFYKQMKQKRIEKTINSTEQIHNEDNLKPRIPPGRRRGRPKYKWAVKGTEEYWNSMKANWELTDTNYKTNWKQYDPENEKQKDFMRQYASAAIPVPEETWKKIQNTQPIWKEWKEGEEWVEEWINSGEKWNIYI